MRSLGYSHACTLQRIAKDAKDVRGGRGTATVCLQSTRRRSARQQLIVVQLGECSWRADIDGRHPIAAAISCRGQLDEFAIRRMDGHDDADEALARL